MSNLFKKANAFYFIASSLTLLTSLALIVTSNVPLPLTLALAALSVLVLALSYKIISNNKKIEIERSKFAQKEQELENKITLGKEAEEAANKEVEKLKNQSRELTREKQNLDKRAKKLAQKVNESEVERESLLEEKKSLEQKLEAKINRVFEITGKLKKIMKEKDELGEQAEELLCKISCLCEQLQKKENDIAKKEERITELKRKIDNNKHAELKNEEFHKEIEKLSKEKEELCKEIEKLCKEKNILYNKKEELYQRQEELYVELDELQCRFKEINQKNKNLSQELKEKSEELDKANDFIESQSFELEGIRKDCNNEVKNLLLKQDTQIEQLEEDLLRERKEKVSYIENMKEYMIRKLEGSIKRSKVIKDDDKAVILQEIPVIRFMLEEVIQDLRNKTPASSLEDLVYASSPDETSIPLHAGDRGYGPEEDSGYNSRSSTPIKLPDLPWTERCKHSQSQNVGLVKCDN
ncbi:coiled-coil domain-containing protein [Wolbachia endosymbiont of Oedothorax gibbosus]|uniref:hypothetical protein n=1 Tax=Wolbachia endosymbiont of Oedothorax gibbosus TaxID=931100 RepID=UPI002024C9CA|nr:hypothetical protein [Wolbachia endosymbiont of Oedothorax gibbosus]